jgi:TPR repeat protein
MLSGFYASGIGVEANYAKATELLETAVRAGSPEGMNLLGVCYEHGLGVQRDHSKALALWRSAAQLGNVDAEYSLGGELIQSRKLEEMAEGVRWLQKAAEQGHYAAHYALSDLYEKGEAGLPKNTKLASYHRATAAELAGE